MSKIKEIDMDVANRYRMKLLSTIGTQHAFKLAESRGVLFSGSDGSAGESKNN